MAVLCGSSGFIISRRSLSRCNRLQQPNVPQYQTTMAFDAQSYLSIEMNSFLCQTESLRLHNILFSFCIWMFILSVIKEIEKTPVNNWRDEGKNVLTKVYEGDYELRFREEFAIGVTKFCVIIMIVFLLKQIAMHFIAPTKVLSFLGAIRHD